MSENNKPDNWQRTLPFPRRWIAYVAIKMVVLVAVVLMVLKWQGLL